MGKVIELQEIALSAGIARMRLCACAWGFEWATLYFSPCSDTARLDYLPGEDRVTVRELDVVLGWRPGDVVFRVKAEGLSEDFDEFGIGGDEDCVA